MARTTATAAINSLSALARLPTTSSLRGTRPIRRPDSRHPSTCTPDAMASTSRRACSIDHSGRQARDELIAKLAFPPSRYVARINSPELWPRGFEPRPEFRWHDPDHGVRHGDPGTQCARRRQGPTRGVVDKGGADQHHGRRVWTLVVRHESSSGCRAPHRRRRRNSPTRSRRECRGRHPACSARPGRIVSADRLQRV